MTNAAPRNHVSELFELCDSGKKGFLTKDDLHLACPQLNEEEITFIFSCLDTNNSGSIDKAEFVAGFEETLCKGESRGFNGMQRKISTTEYFEDEDQQEVHILLGDEGAADEGHTSNVANGTFNYPRKRPKPPRLTKDQTFKVPPQMTLDIPCKEEVLQLYEELQSSGVPQIMSRFEEVVGNLCREIDHKRDENERLQHQQKAERESYNKRMAALENEIDQQLLVAEKKAREEERERLAKEKEELKERLEREMGDLQTNIEHLQKMEKMLKKEAQKNGNQDKLKEKLEEIARENRTLKNNLAENHLEMTLIKAELVEIKSEYENRTLLMALEQEHEQPSVAEAQQIQRQLQLLYDANKRLHDTNDNLRGALDQRTSAIKQLNMLHQHPSLSAFLSPYSRNDSLMSFPDSSATSPPHLQTPDDDNGFPPRTYGAGSRATSSVSDHDLFRCASASADIVSPVPMTLDQQLMMAKQFTANGNAMALIFMSKVFVSVNKTLPFSFDFAVCAIRTFAARTEQFWSMIAQLIVLFCAFGIGLRLLSHPLPPKLRHSRLLQHCHHSSIFGSSCCSSSLVHNARPSNNCQIKCFLRLVGLEFFARDSRAQFVSKLAPPLAAWWQCLLRNFEMNAEIYVPIGTIVADHWTVTGRIGSGAFGTVFRCSKGGQVAALKTEPSDCVRPCLKTEARFLRQVNAEAGAGRRFFCSVLFEGEQPTYRYILMSYGGEPLQNLRNRCGGRLSPETCLDLSIQLLGAIRTLHSIHLLHGDIKEDNICVKNRQLILVDLGLACSYWLKGRHRAQKKRGGTEIVDEPAVSENFELYFSRRFELQVWDYVFRALLFGTAEIIGPEEISRIRVYIDGIEFTAEPDYGLIEDNLRTYILINNYDLSVPYDWESGRRYIDEIEGHMGHPMLPAGTLSYDNKVHSA